MTHPTNPHSFAAVSPLPAGPAPGVLVQMDGISSDMAFGAPRSVELGSFSFSRGVTNTGGAESSIKGKRAQIGGGVRPVKATNKRKRRADTGTRDASGVGNNDEPTICTLPRAPAGKHFPVNPLPSDHVRFLHGEGDARYRYVGLRRLGNRMANGAFNKPSIPVNTISKIAVPNLLSWVDELQGEVDVYLTQADFFWGARDDKSRFRTTAKYLNGIGTLFVDLDTYSDSRWSDHTSGEVADLVLAACDEAGIPKPLLISSGRGMYADWALQERLDVREQSNIEKWKLVQNKLMGLLSRFGADSKVSDITRVLRLVGSQNSKTGTVVRVMYDDGRRHDLDKLVECTQGLPVYVTRKDQVQARSDTGGGTAVSTQTTDKYSSRRPERARAPGTGKTRKLARTQAHPEALERLAAMLRADQVIVDAMPKMRLRHYKVFKDIASLVLSRKGIACGQRDEYQFWMLVSRFNAGLYTADELPHLAEQFAQLCAEPLNLWENGMLSSLFARMQEQRQEQGDYRRSAPAVHTVIRKIGAFEAVRVSAARDASGNYISLGKADAKPMGFGEGYSRPKVYTPSVSTLIDRLDLTQEDQVGLSILVGPVERKRRRSLANVTPQIEARNERMVQMCVDGLSPRQIAIQNNLSVSSVYRVLSRHSARLQIQDGSQRFRNCDNSELKKTVLHVYKRNINNSQHYSIRDIARATGASVSLVQRVVSEYRKRMAQVNSRYRAAQVSMRRKRALELALSDMAICSKWIFPRQVLPLKNKLYNFNMVPALSNVIAVVDSVSYSYFSLVSNRSEELRWRMNLSNVDTHNPVPNRYELSALSQCDLMLHSGVSEVINSDSNSVSNSVSNTASVAGGRPVVARFSFGAQVRIQAVLPEGSINARRRANTRMLTVGIGLMSTPVPQMPVMQPEALHEPVLLEQTTRDQVSGTPCAPIAHEADTQNDGIGHDVVSANAQPSVEDDDPFGVGTHSAAVDHESESDNPFAGIDGSGVDVIAGGALAQEGGDAIGGGQDHLADFHNWLNADGHSADDQGDDAQNADAAPADGDESDAAPVTVESAPEQVHSESHSQSADSGSGDDDLPEDLDGLKAMMLAPGSLDQWGYEQGKLFEARIKECNASWNDAKFRVKVMQAGLMGDSNMREILKQFYEMARLFAKN